MVMVYISANGRKRSSNSMYPYIYRGNRSGHFRNRPPNMAHNQNVLSTPSLIAGAKAGCVISLPVLSNEQAGSTNSKVHF